MAGLIVHEWIEPSGGAEKVVEAMLDAFPDSEMYCLWNDDPGKHGNRKVSESVLAKTYLRKKKSLAVPLMPFIWRNLKLSTDFDWILASSHLFAHQAKLRLQASPYKKYVYAHTPARYLWVPELDQRGDAFLPRLGAAALKPFDKRAAKENTEIAANSQFVKERIASTWEVESRVIYPPVDVSKVQSVASWADKLTGEEEEVFRALPETFILGASRFVPYKRLDLVIKAGSDAGLPVVIAGQGPEEQKLRAQAADAAIPVHFVIGPSDEMLFALYQRTLAFMFPAVEDFGIMPVEAMAAGAPVLVNAVGGAAESVLDGVTGRHLRNFEAATIKNALDGVGSLDKTAIRQRSSVFSRSRFIEELQNWVSPHSDTRDNSSFKGLRG
ncbi:glycosyltransferase [Pseudarthrobacter oxydans]|uniref:glycosyltransferase n=1 Tax=Pseudarthrobacter oxydans TaxID=1671 RepID=UPI003D2E5953